MRVRTRLLVVLLSLVSAAGLLGSPAPASAAAPDWRGDRHAQPSAYSWLNDYTPSDTYGLTVVRGLRPKAVLRALGPVRRDLGDRTPAQAFAYLDRHTTDDLEWPTVVQVQRLGRAVVVYLPYNFLTEQHVRRLSRRGVAVDFSTTVELDTYLTVARRGRVIRTFDAGFRPPRKGALPQERGLDWGARDQNVWSTAWAFSERVSRTRISQEWFEGDHPTYVLRNAPY